MQNTKDEIEDIMESSGFVRHEKKKEKIDKFGDVFAIIVGCCLFGGLMLALMNCVTMLVITSGCKLHYILTDNKPAFCERAWE